MIDVRGGDLVLRNVRLSRDGTAQPTSLIRVDGGHLVLDGCWLTAPGAVEQGGGGLITFRATSTEPRPEPPRLFQTSTDRPNCLLNNTLLITGGNAIKAEVGRGFIALSNCAMAVGGTAFDLRPARVARSRFDAGLWIDRCTVTAEGSFINLGAWLGPKPGPDRPWLVVSNDKRVLANYERSSVATESILLRAEADSQRMEHSRGSPTMMPSTSPTTWRRFRAGHTTSARCTPSMDQTLGREPHPQRHGSGLAQGKRARRQASGSTTGSSPGTSPPPTWNLTQVITPAGPV